VDNATFKSGVHNQVYNIDQFEWRVVAWEGRKAPMSTDPVPRVGFFLSVLVKKKREKMPPPKFH